MKNLQDLMQELDPDDLKEVRARTRAHLAQMSTARKLDELRRILKKTQGDIAEAMGIGQNAVSQLEKRDDLQLSTLNRYVESLGLSLELTVVAKNGDRVGLKGFKPWNQGTEKKIRVKAGAVRPASLKSR